MAISVGDLRVVLPSSKSDADLTAFIATAGLIVDEDLRPTAGLSDARYDKIQLYLAAHFMALSTVDDGTAAAIKSSKMGESTDTYDQSAASEFGYSSTKWGQMALVLDTSGKLAAATGNKGVKALFSVIQARDRFENELS